MGIHQHLFGKYLLVTNTVSCGLLMGVGDVIQQRGEHWRQHHFHKFFPSEGSSSIATESNQNAETSTNQEFEHNYIRTKNMTTVGIMQGPFHHYFYAMLDKILPGRNTISVIKKTFIDQAIASPVCLAIFFFGHGTLEHRNLQEINDEVKLKLLDTWKVDCCFWPPTQFINFLLVPIQYRVIYINLMTMIYDIFLSYIKYDAQFN